MTWYRGDERIGDDVDVANAMLDAAIEQTEEGIGYMDDFRAYVNERFEPMEVLETCTRDRVGLEGFFIDWAVDQLQYNDAYGERYGFTWREE